jgi:hypothetical protein
MASNGRSTRFQRSSCKNYSGSWHSDMRPNDSALSTAGDDAASNGKQYPHCMRWIVILAMGLAITGCGAGQPERAVAAFEVPLQSEADRNQFLAILRAAAEAEGMHVDAVSSQELEREAKVGPEFEMTVNAAVWRGSNDEEAVASAMDHHDHLRQVWITFFGGKNPTVTGRFRESATREIMRRWPGTLSLPIMPTGAIPLHRDLVRTANGYVVNPSEAHKYALAGAEKSRP